MEKETPAMLRKSARDFSLKALREMKNARTYAMTPQAETVVASLARSMFIKREIENRKDGDGKSPSAYKEFHGIIESLARAGVNILQARPNEPKPLPAPWLNPLTNQPLLRPTSPDERALLAKRDPDLLQWFDRLEKEPYKTLADHMDAEAAREAMTKIEYTSDTHEANPWRRGDQTEMAALVKRDAVLAQFCQAEAKDVELNLFGANRDLTVRGKLFKDPEAASIVELAEKIDQLWRQEDRAAAATAKEAAEAKLRELSLGERPQPLRIAQRARVGVE